MKWDIIMDNEFKPSLQWVIDLLKRVLEDVFAFVAEKEGWK